MKQLQKLANITQFNFVSTPVKGEEITLFIEGMLSDPAWEIQRESVDINNPKNKISVKIWIKRDPNVMAAQVTKKFVKEVKITFPHAGKWIIQVNDKNLEALVE